MSILLGIIVLAVVAASVGLTLWLLPNEGYGQKRFGTDDWPSRADLAPRIDS